MGRKDVKDVGKRLSSTSKSIENDELYSHFKQIAKTLTVRGLPRPQDIEKDDLYTHFKSIGETLKQKYSLTNQQLIYSLQPKEENSIPISIFTKQLSCLETIVKFLKEEKQLTYHQTGVVLNRNDRTIWITYHNAQKKKAERLAVKPTNYILPTSIFTDRRLSVLEAIVRHLKDNYGLRYTDIAGLIQRSERNLWKVYNKKRAK